MIKTYLSNSNNSVDEVMLRNKINGQQKELLFQQILGHFSLGVMIAKIKEYFLF
jgi:hypothetical protein